jgi:two-component system, chemotaxis family, protein-glutamate methylesterase/glutaminase
MSNRDIIVIGGSAGATAPLKQILGRLPPDLPAAVFIVLHIPAQGIGILSTVASSAGPLPVRQAENGMKIEPGQVYLAAPDHHLLLSEDCVFLVRARTWSGRPSTPCFARPPSITARA